MELAESRWAHREAHKREIREVAEFMSIDDDDRNEEEEDDNFGAVSGSDTVQSGAVLDSPY